MPKRIAPVHRAVRDKVLAEAVDVARQALADVTRLENVGEHAGLMQEADRVVTHAFECLLPGYVGWYWTATITRATRSKHITVIETSIRPGADALLATEWVPWSERLQPSDVGPSDRLPYKPDDENLRTVDQRLDGSEDGTLMQGFEETGADADNVVLFELGLGRARLLSDQGRAQAYRRWYRSDAGPRNQATRDAKAPCATCGYLMHLGGSARQLFGVCANEWSPFDGRVVSMDHGCGAHSETDIPEKHKLWEQTDPVVDETDIGYDD